MPVVRRLCNDLVVHTSNNLLYRCLGSEAPAREENEHCNEGKPFHENSRMAFFETASGRIIKLNVTIVTLPARHRLSYWPLCFSAFADWLSGEDHIRSRMDEDCGNRVLTLSADVF